MPGPASRLVRVGLPWDASSSFLRGASDAPALIRQALWSPSTNTSTGLGIDVDPRMIDAAGDIPLGQCGRSLTASGWTTGQTRVPRCPWRRSRGHSTCRYDLDGLDPAFAPGVSHPEPGGLSVGDVVRLVAIRNEPGRT